MPETHCTPEFLQELYLPDHLQRCSGMLIYLAELDALEGSVFGTYPDKSISVCCAIPSTTTSHLAFHHGHIQPNESLFGPAADLRRAGRQFSTSPHPQVHQGRGLRRRAPRAELRGRAGRPRRALRRRARTGAVAGEGVGVTWWERVCEAGRSGDLITDGGGWWMVADGDVILRQMEMDGGGLGEAQDRPPSLEVRVERIAFSVLRECGVVHW